MSAVSPNSATVNRAEHELLLCCIRPDLPHDIVDQIRKLAREELDWEYLFLLARRHGVSPLLYKRLDQTASNTVPASELQRLQQYFQENAARNVLLTAELCRVLNVLQENQIEAIPFKGPALAVFAYLDIALRRFVDLDVMVRREDASKAIEILLKEGFEFAKPLTEGQLDVLLRTQHNVQFRRYGRQLIVELHWEVASHLFASSVQADDLWQSLEVIELNHTRVKTLAADDLLFSLCVHGSRHLWERLLWISDIASIMWRRELDWDGLVQRARKTQCERMFLLGITLAVGLLGAKAPDSVCDLISSDQQLDKLSSSVVEGLFSGTVHRPASSGRIFRYNLTVRKTWPARLRYIRHMLNPTDRDLDAVALPARLVFGYYLVRPLRLLFKTSESK